MKSSGNIDDGPGEAQEHHLGDVNLFHLADVLLFFFPSIVRISAMMQVNYIYQTHNAGLFSSARNSCHKIQ